MGVDRVLPLVNHSLGDGGGDVANEAGNADTGVKRDA